MSFSLSTATNLFKIKYGKISDNTYNSANVMASRIVKKYDFTGRRMEVSVPTSFSGGVGAGSLPTANKATYEMAIISAKKVYSVIQVDRESIKAAENDEGAFVRLTKESVKKGIESYNRLDSCFLWGDGNGALGSFSGNATGTATAPVLTITAATWKEANFEERDYVNVNTLASVFEITAVDPATRAVTLSRISGSDDLTGIGAGTHVVYMQNSKDLAPTSIKQALDATSSTLYGVNVGRRWQAWQKTATGGLTVDYLNEGMLGVERQCGKTPNLIVMGYVQYRKFLNLLEDQKEYIVEPRMGELKGKVSFRAIEFMSQAGPVPVIYERFVEDDRVYLLNDNYIIRHHRPGSPGWADDDGTVFMRTSGDEYEARYCSYYENYIAPSFHGRIKSLST